MNDNRQLRMWLCILYEDNQKHLDMLEELKASYLDYWYINHVAQYDENGELIKKSHFHCCIWFPIPTRLNTIIKKFNLDDEDRHLFMGLNDLKKSNGHRMFKTINNYIDYTTHQGNDDKPDKYTIDDFVTNVPDRIYNALNDNERDNNESLIALLDFMENERRKDHGLNWYSIADWYILANNKGYGITFYKNWNKIKDVLDSYRNEVHYN